MDFFLTFLSLLARSMRISLFLMCMDTLCLSRSLSESSSSPLRPPTSLSLPDPKSPWTLMLVGTPPGLDMYSNQSQHFSPTQRRRLCHPRANWPKNHSSQLNPTHSLPAMPAPPPPRTPLCRMLRAARLLPASTRSWLFLNCRPTLCLLLGYSLLVLTQAPNLSPSYRSPLTPLQGEVPSLPPRGHLSIRQRRAQQAHPTQHHHPAPALEECHGGHDSTQSRIVSWGLLASIAGNCKVSTLPKCTGVVLVWAAIQQQFDASLWLCKFNVARTEYWYRER